MGLENDRLEGPCVLASEKTRLKEKVGLLPPSTELTALLPVVILGILVTI